MDWSGVFVMENFMSNEWIVWVMDWHWGWQVFVGLMVLGLLMQFLEWAVKPTEDKLFDLKIWGLQFTAWCLNLFTTILGITVIVFIVWLVIEASGAAA